MALLEFDLQDRVWWRHDCAAYDLRVTPFGQSSDPLLVRDAMIGAVPGAVLQRIGVAPSSTLRLFQMLRPKTAQDLVRGQDAKPIAFRWRSAPASFDGDSHIGKRLAELRVGAVGPASVWQLRNYAPDAEPLGDLGATGGSEPGSWGVDRPGLWGVPRGDYTWGGVGQLADSKFHTLGVARAWQLEVRGLSVSEFELDSYAVFVGPRPRRD
jgi:hypothetical protein